ncbi:MAG: hypothetical protein HLUCCA04_01195 [Oceanicaulis sp. HLUCCA04]|nr:MAG: hypothetical protein HLUCCA04_01195 [Oceanicaulis sp. HLUCCA04]
MPCSFKVLEPVAGDSVSEPFGVGGHGVPAFECVRMLAGSTDLESKKSGASIKLRYCHFTQKQRRPNDGTISDIIDLAFEGELTREEVGQFLTKSKSDNFQFWEELKSEIGLCLFALKMKRHTESFLYIYRTFELIAVAMPLIYASRVSDFRSSVQFIKSLSRNDRDQDLSILKYFTEEFVKRESMFAHLHIDYSFSSLGASAGEMRDQLKSYVLAPNKIHHEFFDVEEEGVKIKFSAVPSFVAASRNRLFHNALSNDNFKIDALSGADSVCEVLVRPSIYFFSLLLIEILKVQAKRYI